MPKYELPNLPEELRAQLIMELYKFAAVRERIWKYNAPAASLAELTKAIATNTRTESYSLSTFLTQELNKAPELHEKVKPFLKIWK